jgi:hypothetical protein
VKKCGFIDGRKQRKQIQILLMRPDAQAALSDTEKNTYKEFIRKKAKVMVAVCMAAAAVVGLVGAGVAFLIMPVL